MLLVDRNYLEPQDFTLTRTISPVEFSLPAEGVKLEEVERQLLVQALERSAGNQTQAAQAARHQPRPGAVPHREIRTLQDRVTRRLKPALYARRLKPPLYAGVGDGRARASACAALSALMDARAAAVSLTGQAGHSAVRTTRSATLPSSRCATPPRP